MVFRGEKRSGPEELAEVGGKEFVDDRPRRGEKDFDPAGMMAVDKPIPTDPQPVEALQFSAQRLDVTSRQSGQGCAGAPPRFRGQTVQIIANLIGKNDVSLQRRRGDETSICRRAAA